MTLVNITAKELTDMEDISKLHPTIFRLTDQEWEEFNRVLDRDPVFMPGMQALLSKPSVFIPEDE